MARTYFALLTLAICATSAFGQDVVRWKTYLGGQHNEEPYAIAVGGDGSVYLVGATQSPDFPTTSNAWRAAPPRTSQRGQGRSLQIVADQYIGFLARLDPTGERLIYGTYVGGSVRDSVNEISLSPSGDVYIGGMTDSPDLPVTANATQKQFGGKDSGGLSAPGDGFVARLNRQGGLEFATFLGGSSSDVVSAVAAGPGESVYATGSTSSTDFMVEQAPSGVADGFVAKIDTCSGKILWSLRLVGSGTTAPTGVAVAEDGSVFVAGTRDSARSGEGRDAFVAEISTNGELLKLSSVGGSGDERVAGPAIGPDRGVHLAGMTASTDVPTTTGAWQEDYQGGQSDGFVAKLGIEAGQSFTTYLGSEVYENVSGVAVDQRGLVHLVGDVIGRSGLTTTTGAPPPPQETAQELFYAVLGANGQRLEFLSRHGGRSVTPGIFRVTREAEIAIGPDGDAYVVAMTTDDFVASQRAYQPETAGGHELIVLRISLDGVR